MEPFKFFPYSWYVDEKEEEITSIRVYGLLEDNQNVCVRIDNFTPYVYIELPTYITWNESKAQLVCNKIDELLGHNKPLKKTFCMKRKLYYANLNNKKKPKLFPYLCCVFSNKKDIKILSYKLNKTLPIVGLGNLKFKMHEQDANVVLQLCCTLDISTTGWIQAFGKKIEDENEKITLCDSEYIIKYKNMKSCEVNTIPKPKLMGFDIEVNSTNPSAMPKSHIPGDKVFQISSIFSTEGQTENEYKKYLLSLGKPDQKTVGEDTILLCFETEAELLTGFTNLIRTENPNIIVGYNILGFDIPYMIERSKLEYCYPDFNKQGFHKYNHANEKTIKWSSSAYKNQEFQYLDAEGRLFVDLLPLIRRDFKLDNYKLKTVSEFFLKDTKDDLSPQGIFKCYRIGMKGGTKGSKALGICGKYCSKDSILVLKLMEKLQIFTGLTEMAAVCNVQPFSLYTQGQQIKVYSQVYKYCYINNIVVEKDVYVCGENERYTGAYVIEPIPGCYDNVVSFDFSSLYPSVIIAYNIDYSTLVLDENIPDKDCHIMDFEEHIGCVHDPKVIRKNELTSFIDSKKDILKKLREKRDKTKDKTKKSEIIKQIDDINIQIKPYQEERTNLVKSKPKFPMCEKRYYRFLKEPKGVIPTILDNLLNARKNTRDQIKENKNKIKLTDNKSLVKDLLLLNNVLDKRQLAYKISANSMYGSFGVKKDIYLLCQVLYAQHTLVEKV